MSINNDDETKQSSSDVKRSFLPHANLERCIPPNTNTLPSMKTSKNNKNNGSSAIEDDWEAMFDDNGECLDSKIINEISEAVGKVSLSKSKSNYKETHKTINLEEEEFPHVLEVSNFPVEFKTQDLMMIFSGYKEAGFDIKWVDDTHALVVFSSSKCGKLSKYFECFYFSQANKYYIFLNCNYSQLRKSLIWVIHL